MTLLTDALALARKDLLVELRARQMITAASALGGVALVLVGLAVGPDPARLRMLAPALVWIALLYTAIAIAERLDRIDRSDDAFAGLWLAVADRRSIYLGRIVSLATVLALVQLAIWLAASVLLDLALGIGMVALLPLVLLTAIAAATVSTLTLALIAEGRHRSLLLPVALMPLLVPTFLAGVQASAAVLEERFADATPWGAVLLIETALFLGLGLLTYETAASPG